MLNYVNTVLVSNKSYSNAGDTLFVPAAGNNYMPSTSDAGKFIIMNCDANVSSNNLYNVNSSASGQAGSAADIQTIKVGYITSKSMTLRKKDGTTVQEPIIKWSNEIKAADIKSYTYHAYAADTEDIAYIDLDGLTETKLIGSGNGGKRIIVRLTYKDMPHRYRKWTESYEYVVEEGDTKATIAANIAKLINKEWKRARVSAIVGDIDSSSSSSNGTLVVDGNTKYFHNDSNWGTATATTGTAIKLEAMKYDDDDSVDSLSWANKVRFNANMYWTDPAAEGWESNNKNFPKGVNIVKVPGKQHVASNKLVRDRESWAMGYQGILNRGEGTWPIIKPEMVTSLDPTVHYNALTLEFENMYRAADDIQRKTKQNLEIYTVVSTEIKAVLDRFVNGVQQDEEVVTA